MNHHVARAMTGDIEAFGRMIEERQERMTRLAMAILGTPSDADDALQDWLVSVWRNLPNLREADRFDAWSDRILVNACRRILRSRGRDRLRMVPLASDPEYGRRAAEVMSGSEDAGADRDALEQAFETLSAEDRAAVVLHHVEGRPLAEIATHLGIPTGTLKARLHRARFALRRALEDEVS